METIFELVHLPTHCPINGQTDHVVNQDLIGEEDDIPVYKLIPKNQNIKTHTQNDRD
jgi:hypothetical protein